jgi:hypothetical protein
MLSKKSMPTPISGTFILNDLELAVASSVQASCRVFVIFAAVFDATPPVATASTPDDPAKARSQKLTSVVIGINAAYGGQLAENTGD